MVDLWLVGGEIDADESAGLLWLFLNTSSDGSKIQAPFSLR